MQQEVDIVEKSFNWTIAKNWAEWWMRPSHLQMLHKYFHSWIQVFGIGALQQQIR